MTPWQDRHGVTGRAGDGADGLVDHEVVTVETSGNRQDGRVRLDRPVVSRIAERGEGLTRAVGGVGEDLESRLLAREQLDAGRPVGGVGGDQGDCVDESGLELDREVAQTVTAVEQQCCKMRECDTRIATSGTLHQWQHSLGQGRSQTESIGQFLRYQRARSSGRAPATWRYKNTVCCPKYCSLLKCPSVLVFCWSDYLQLPCLEGISAD